MQTEQRDAAFREKWKHRLMGPPKTPADGSQFAGPWVTDGNGSYIDLSGIPLPWYDVLDETLTEVQSRHPDFRIMQLKLKLGTVRIHLANVPLAEMKEIKSMLNMKLEGQGEGKI
jgi:hypothetical protein